MEAPESRLDKSDSEGSRLLEAIASMMQNLAEASSIELALTAALRILGEAARVDRVYIFKNGIHPDSGVEVCSQAFEWVASGISPQIGNPELQNMSYHPGVSTLHHALVNGRPFICFVDEAPEPLRSLLESQDIKSIAVLPVLVSGQFWGFIGFDDCRNRRVWSPQTLRMLEAASSAIGSSLKRREVDEALLAANTELRNQTEELRRIQRITISLMEDAKIAQKQAARASAAKSEFLAVMSHEMRTPLNGILGFTDILMDEHDPKLLRETASIIRDSGKVLLDLISDVLDFSKIESGHLEMDPSPVVIREMVAEVMTSLSGSLLGKRISLELVIAEDVPVAVVVDNMRLRQILLNVLGNAVKFTNEGRIEVRIRSSVGADGLVTLSFDVEDSGIGIAESALEQIFEPFDQADRSVHRRFGGTGLGLSISRRLCRLMHGNLTVQSTLDKGSTFSFSVRCHWVDADTVQIEESVVTAVPLLAEVFPMEVLVVDDVATNRLLACRLLAKMGYAADTASDGERAVQMVMDKDYQLILMDVFMPGIDGCESTRKIRQWETHSGRKCTILGLSADVMNDNRRRCIESGMDGFLTKPIRVPDFVAAIRNLTADSGA